MRYGWRVEQLFVRRAGSGWSVLAVLEAPSGARRRETLPTQASSPERAVAVFARQLALRGDVDGTRRLRVREERGERLLERTDLARAFEAALDEALGADAD